MADDDKFVVDSVSVSKKEHHWLLKCKMRKRASQLKISRRLMDVRRLTPAEKHVGLTHGWTVMPMGLPNLKPLEESSDSFRGADAVMQEIYPGCPNGYFVTPTKCVSDELKSLPYVYSKPFARVSTTRVPSVLAANRERGRDRPLLFSQVPPENIRAPLPPPGLLSLDILAPKKQIDFITEFVKACEHMVRREYNKMIVAVVDFHIAYQKHSLVEGEEIVVDWEKCRFSMDSVSGNLYQATYTMLEHPDIPEWVYVLANLVAAKPMFNFFGLQPKMLPNTEAFQNFKRTLKSLGWPGAEILSKELLPTITSRATPEDIENLLQEGILTCKNPVCMSFPKRLIGLCSLYRASYWPHHKKLKNPKQIKMMFYSALRFLLDTTTGDPALQPNPLLQLILKEYLEYLRAAMRKGVKRVAARAVRDDISTDSDNDSEFVPPLPKQMKF